MDVVFAVVLIGLTIGSLIATATYFTEKVRKRTENIAGKSQKQ